jgi:hypothetical protein
MAVELQQTSLRYRCAKGDAMICYECSLAGTRSDAVGLCHFCSAGLCAEHANVLLEEIRAHEVVVKTVALPRKARRMFCSVCRDAVEQPNAEANLQHGERSQEEEKSSVY